MTHEGRDFVIINNGGRTTRTLMTEAFRLAGIKSLRQSKAGEEFYSYGRFKDKGDYHSIDRAQWTGYLTDESMERVLAAFYALVTDPHERRLIETYHD
jgi:hypothetical protein